MIPSDKRWKPGAIILASAVCANREMSLRENKARASKRLVAEAGEAAETQRAGRAGPEMTGALRQDWASNSSSLKTEN